MLTPLYRAAALLSLLLLACLLPPSAQADYDCCLPTGLVMITNLEVTTYCWDCCCPSSQGEDCDRVYNSEATHYYGGMEYLYEGACGEGEDCEHEGAIPCGQGGWSKTTEWLQTLGDTICDHCEVDLGCYPRPPGSWSPDEWRICLCPPEEDCVTYLLSAVTDPCESLDP